MVQRPAGSTAIEIAPPILCVALRAIDATREAFALQSDLRRPHAGSSFSTESTQNRQLQDLVRRSETDTHPSG